MTKKIAAVFPGQGSQSADMAAAYESCAEVAAAIDEAAAAANLDLQKIIADKTELDKTENTQPALLAVCVGVFRAAKISAESFAAMAGHSLGEYAALVCANAIDFCDAVCLVRRRGELMRDAAKGGMAAVIGEAESVAQLCAESRENGGQIWAANYNSPQQTVVAGNLESIAAAKEWISNSGIKRVIPLPVSIPSHCPLMQNAADVFAEELRKIQWRTPSVPVLHNATLQSAANVEEIVSALAAQLVSPVRWDATIGKFGGRESPAMRVLGVAEPFLAAVTAAEKISVVYEFGPGGVLTGLAKRILDSPPHVSLATKNDLDFARVSFDSPQNAESN